MTDPEDPIAAARRLLADKALYADNLSHLWRADVAKRAPRLLAALCDRLEAAEREFRQTHEDNCTPDYTDRSLHSSYCLLYMVGPE